MLEVIIYCLRHKRGHKNISAPLPLVAESSDVTGTGGFFNLSRELGSSWKKEENLLSLELVTFRLGPPKWLGQLR